MLKILDNRLSTTIILLMSGKAGSVIELKNKKAYHEYQIEDKFEAGVVLCGTEVKSIRVGKAQVTDGFVRIEKGNAILYNTYIEEYAFGNTSNHNPQRPRQLLLHKREIRKLKQAVDTAGYSIVLLKMYFKGPRVKVEIGLGKGKKAQDKRGDIKKRIALQEAERALKRFQHG